jgi:hypothetical protein
VFSIAGNPRYKKSADLEPRLKFVYFSFLGGNPPIFNFCKKFLLKNNIAIVFPTVGNPRVQKISRFGDIFEIHIFFTFKGVTPNF